MEAAQLEAYRDGMDASQLGKPLDSNPHAENTAEHDAWREGWFDVDGAAQ